MFTSTVRLQYKFKVVKYTNDICIPLTVVQGTAIIAQRYNQPFQYSQQQCTVQLIEAETTQYYRKCTAFMRVLLSKWHTHKSCTFSVVQCSFCLYQLYCALLLAVLQRLVVSLGNNSCTLHYCQGYANIICIFDNSEFVLESYCRCKHLQCIQTTKTLKKPF